ncbi:hypothetical protein BOX15_Mlig033735g2 [Macrostomum lignano]|uniref:Uncharacterized protein n=1 Tax=Macrostomum lignano TaxID=282301 RepID=A0A267H4A1_9PLAT|nr:hypothetical protein BOX15_Mlig033735g2 [Macrostomum lignano]
MGCGASKSVSVIKSQPIRPASGQAKAAGSQQQPQGGVGTPKKLPPIKSEAAGTPPAGLTVEDEKSGKGGVAFSIAVDGGGAGGSGGSGGGGSSMLVKPNSDIDKILRKPLPPRLRHLEPLDSVPVMSPEQLAEKLRKAEEKRERMLEKRRHSKVTKKSKARRELLKAQDFAGNSGAATAAAGTAASVDLSASSGAGGNLESLQQKQASAEQKRLAQLAAVQEKQRLREERARAARERARLMKQEQLESELQIEKDEADDDSDTDSWLGDNDGQGRGRQRQPKNAASAPPLGHQQSQRDSSGYSSRDASSATDPAGRGGDSAAGSRVQTGKTVSTVLEGELDNDFYD